MAESNDSSIEKIQGIQTKLYELLISKFDSLKEASAILTGLNPIDNEISTLRRIVGKGGTTTPLKYKKLKSIEYHDKRIRKLLDSISDEDATIESKKIIDKAFRIVPHNAAEFAGDYISISLSTNNNINIFPFQISPKGYVRSKYIRGEKLLGIAGYDSNNLSILIMQKQTQDSRPSPFYFHLLFYVGTRAGREDLFTLEGGVSSRRERKYGLPKAGRELLTRVDGSFEKFTNSISLSKAEQLPSDTGDLPVLIRDEHSLDKSVTVTLNQIIDDIRKYNLLKDRTLVVDDNYVDKLKALQKKRLT